MHRSKVLNFLHSLSSKELKSFSTFIASPFYNKDKEVIRLLDSVKLYHPDFTSKNLSKSLIYEKLYPELPYEDKRMRYLMSHLLKLGERFFLVQKIEAGSTSVSLQLLNEFVSRNLDKHYTPLRNKLSHQFSENSIINVDYFFEKMQMADLEEKHFSLQHRRQFDDKIQHESDNLNRYFALKKLKYVCGMLDRQALLKGTYELDLPENWTTWLSSNDYWREKIIKIYTGVFLALKHEDKPEYFEELNKLLLAETTEISPEDLKELFLYAINYCARKIRKGENQYIEKALNLYLEGIRGKALLEDAYLSPWTFGNVIKLALRLEKYDWIENFMENHKHYLSPDFQENAMSYNLADLYCYKKDFNTALTFLFKVEFSDLSYHLGSRIMLSKIYYELKEQEALLSLMSSFIMFLKRNKKISEPIRKTCLNFCDLLFLIIRGKPNRAAEKIENMTLLTDRGWLLEKIKEASK